jgi:membrane-bound lytic murein transglycosylase MltF
VSAWRGGGAWAALLLAAAAWLAGCQREPEPSVSALPTQPFFGDLDEIRERRVLRALVVPSRTDFFLSGARIEGLQARLLDEYLAHLNRGVPRIDHVRLRYLPVSFDRLLPELEAGHGDIAAALLTVTPEREARVAMVSSEAMPVDEVVVHHRDAEPVERLEDLAGREVLVLRGSSYAEHLRALNEDFDDLGLAPVRITEAESALRSEDILELVDAGVVPLTVVDDYKARLWSQVFDDLVVRPGVRVNAGGHVGWAVRQGNPQLQASLNSFLHQVKPGTTLGNVLDRRFLGQTRWIRNPTGARDRARLAQLMPLFERHGQAYGIDPLVLLALAFHESGLDASLRSPRGAVGLMQLLPSTASDPNVDIPDIWQPDNNVHAAAKYLAFLRDRYFSSDDIDPQARMAFVWAAYNAGPARVRRMRAMAEEMGLDPNRWFGHVELAAGQLVGVETVKYVADVRKYLVAYRLMQMHEQARSALTDQARGQSPFTR